MTEAIRLAHGGGGLAMRQLVRDLFSASFSDKTGSQVVQEDAAVADFGNSRMAFTTDTFVVDPIFFPGGNIGDLAINGTVNDLAMMGATPRFLSVAMILEEGLPMETLEKIVATMADAARAVPVPIVTGDTKVVPKGKADQLFVNTTGVGEVRDGVRLSAANLTPGDKLIVSGPIGDHGVAVMTRRAGLSFEADVSSDTQALGDLVGALFEEGPKGAIRALRDPTRGGLGAVLCELAEDSKVTIELTEQAVPVRPAVRAACDVLGLDPLHVPCEGRLVAAVAEDAADRVLETMTGHAKGRQAAVIGTVTGESSGSVLLRTRVGGLRHVDLPAGELLPRIC